MVHMLIILADFYDVPNYLGPFRNRFPLNLYRKLPLVNSLSLNQSEMVFKKSFEALHFELMIPKHQQINV